MLWQHKMRRSIQFKIVLGLHESHDPLVLHRGSRGAPLEILGAFVVAFLSKGLDSKCFFLWQEKNWFSMDMGKGFIEKIGYSFFSLWCNHRKYWLVSENISLL